MGNSNSTSTATATATGVGFLNLLTLIFVAAKVFGFIAWSWWLVFLPTIIWAGLIFVVLAFAVIILALAGK